MTLASGVARSRVPQGSVRLLAATAIGLMLVGLSAELQAQDTTYIGGGGGPDGQRVIVNMDALEGGTAPQRYQAPNAAAGEQDVQVDQDFVGQMVEGPKGVFLRFPPRTAPRSHLTVDPNELGDLSETDQAAAQAPSLTPPDQRGSQTQAEKTPPKPTTRPQQQTRTVVEETLAPSEPEPEQLQATAEPETTVTPTPKPTAPEPSADSRQASAEGSETASMPSPPPPPSETETAEAETEAPAPTPPQQKPAQSTVAQASPEPEPAAPNAEPQVAEPEPTSTATPEPAPSEPAVEDAAEPDPETTQTARLPEQGLPEQVRLDFGSGSAELGEQQREMLDALADRLKQNDRQRIQLMAFAEGTEETASRARRLSLSRALAVRSYLIDQGIRSTRMDVRALGNTADSGPLDRVDIVPANR